METTETVEMDGTIEGAIANLIEPEESLDEELEEEDGAEDDEQEPDSPEEDEESDDEDEEQDDSEDDVDTDDAVQSGQTHSVKVNGEEVSVTLEELKQGYSGQKYVQQGMQVAASQRKQAEDVYNALLNERQNIAQLYQQVQSGGFAQPPVQPSRELFDTDPIGFMDAKLRYDDDLGAYNAQVEQLKTVTAQQSQAQEAAKQAYLQQEMATLQEVIPEFSDQKKASAVRDKMLKLGTEVYGYQADEIGQIMDHRAIRVLHDAIKYREIMGGKQAAEDKANPANRRKRPVKAGSKPTTSNSKKVAQRRSKLTNSGSISDALGLILQ